MQDFDKAISYLMEEVGFENGYGYAHTKHGLDKKVNSDSEAFIAHCISDAMAKSYFKRWQDGLMCYTGKRWVKVGVKTDLPKIVYEVLRKKEVGVAYRMPPTVGKITRVVDDNKNIPTYGGDKRYICFRNCVLDMATREQLEFSEEYESMVYLDIDYDPDATCPLWDSTIKNILADDANIAVLYEFMGLTFIDRNKLNVETAMFFVGTGSNGKGVVSEMMENIFGENISSTAFDMLCTHNQADYYRAEIAGKLLNFCSDMGTKEFSNGVFKTLISKEPITCRNIFERPFRTRDFPLMGASINKMPVVTDSTKGFWRRCQFIPFDRTFADKEQDKTLKFRLKSEVSGVFNHVLRGMERILKADGNFTYSASMDKAGTKAKIESSSVLSWMQEHCYVGLSRLQEMKVAGELKDGEYSEIRMFASDIMKSYTTYCDENNNGAKSRTNLNDDLKAEGFVYKDKMRIAGELKVSSGFIFYRIDKEEILDEIAEQKAIDELPF